MIEDICKMINYEVLHNKVISFPSSKESIYNYLYIHTVIQRKKT